MVGEKNIINDENDAYIQLVTEIECGMSSGTCNHNMEDHRVGVPRIKVNNNKRQHQTKTMQNKQIIGRKVLAKFLPTTLVRNICLEAEIDKLTASSSNRPKNCSSLMNGAKSITQRGM